MILIIDNYDSFTYNLYQLLSEYVDEVKVVRNDKITVEQVKDLSPNGIILSPGPGRPEKAGICIPLIKNLAETIPILGVCLGHQAIAAAFGGEVIHANQIIHGKNSLVFHNRSALYADISLPFQAGRYHSLIVKKNSLPSELCIQAETNDGTIMGIKHLHYPTYGVQFHPESILSEEGSTLLKNFVSLCKETESC